MGDVLGMIMGPFVRKESREAKRLSRLGSITAQSWNNSIESCAGRSIKVDLGRYSGETVRGGFPTK